MSEPSDGGLPVERQDEEDRIDLLAAALRADANDLSSYEKVLFATIAGTLPDGVVEVSRDRSLGDRMAGRPGTVRAIRIHLADEVLELAQGRGAPTASIAREVRGVTISTAIVGLAEWSRRLAQSLEKVALDNAETRDALARLLGMN